MSRLDTSKVMDRDWGSDTLARFRYQTEVTLPYCLSMLSNPDDILSVIPEYLEDIALKTNDGWRFLQVKTRDPERGLWTASALFVKKGGALRSLYRTYLLTIGEDHPLELLLEGAIKTNDPICTLYTGEDRSQLVPMVMNKLRSSQASATDFLRRVTLNESMPHRSAIHATNARLLHELAPSLTHPELEALHSSFLDEIEKAMRCERLSALWPRSIVHPKTRSTTTEDRLRAKTLDAARLSAIATPLTRAERPLLKRFVEPGSRPVTPLTQKLILGGAPPALVERARSLQANAHHQRFVRASQNLANENAVLSDLHERLLTYAQTETASQELSDRPAVGMWQELLDKFARYAGQIDRNNLICADPMLLMGETCILSDECVFDWGKASDAG